MKKFNQFVSEKCSRVFLATVAMLSGAGLCGTANAQQSASLQWSPSTGATGYALYVGPAAGYYTKRIDVGTNTTVTVTGLLAGVTNCFVATAYNSAGLESPASNLAQFLAAVSNQPPPVTNPVVFTATPLSIANIGGVLVSAAGVSNQTWLLQSSTNLNDWSYVFTNVSGQPLSFSTTLPLGQGWRFYRALAVIGPVTAASIASAASNHYFSANSVGFVKINAGRGETLIANPFDCGNNTVAALLPSVPAGSVLYQYTSGAGYTSNIFSGGQWAAGGMVLGPGDGGFFYNPGRTAQKIVFAGRVLQNSVTNFVPTGYSITSPMIPLLNSVATLPASPGDVIQCYSGKWIDYTNVSGAWVGNPKYGALTVNPGSAFFITKRAAVNWVQNWTGN